MRRKAELIFPSPGRLSVVVQRLKHGCGWSVRAAERVLIGTYPTPWAALRAGRTYLRIRRSRKVCTLDEIDQVRRELARIDR